MFSRHYFPLLPLVSPSRASMHVRIITDEVFTFISREKFQQEISIKIKMLIVQVLQVKLMYNGSRLGIRSSWTASPRNRTGSHKSIDTNLYPNKRSNAAHSYQEAKRRYSTMHFALHRCRTTLHSVNILRV